ncbi:cytochrome P450 [Pseudooceanicola sp.]|uniref:cytochrome P450 n=1 Tax=Pseudooceanicola sp. TaxID=1914328 RepID=UPI00405927D7
MQTLRQSPTDPAFVQDPYPFYAAARAQGPIHRWAEYDMAAAFSHGAVTHCLKDRRMGREAPPEHAPAIPDRLRAFYEVEAHSMLELEAPRHTRLRRLVLSAFTSRRIAGLEPEIAALCDTLIDDFPHGAFDLIPAYANRIPVIVIARLLGVPESMADDLLGWSNAMVSMYQARRTPEIEAAACAAASDFADFMRDYVEERRSRPADDLITHLIAAEEDGERLSTDELISTCILLLNAGHEATVHGTGNGVKTLLEHGMAAEVLTPDAVAGTVEEILRYDPPLHMFTRWVYEDLDVMGRPFRRGDRIALLLGAANRDPQVWEDPDVFDPTRRIKTNTSFGAGAHFCVGAPLARLEMQVALPRLFARCPGLRLAEAPRYADLYHFHGLERLMVERG